MRTQFLRPAQHALSPQPRFIFCRHRQAGAALLNLIVLLLVIAVAGGGWYGWQMFNAVSDDNQSLRDQLAGLQAAQARQAQAQEQASDAAAQRLDALDVSMANRDEQLAQMQAGGQRNWLLNEAEALASLAQERLALTADITAAERLLQAADKTLARINDARMLPARKALAADREKLRAASQVDVEALVLQLGALQKMLDDVAIAVTAPEDVGADKPALPDAASWWDKLLYGLPVTVRHQDSALPLPLDAQQASSLRLYLDNALQQAQLSLLQRKPDGFRQALTQADKAVAAWLDNGNTRIRHLRAAIADLQNTDVEQALPEIGDGLSAIRALQAESAQ